VIPARGISEIANIAANPPSRDAVDVIVSRTPPAAEPTRKPRLTRSKTATLAEESSDGVRAKSGSIAACAGL
jgi:hypothetical protein